VSVDLAALEGDLVAILGGKLLTKMTEMEEGLTAEIHKWAKEGGCPVEVLVEWSVEKLSPPLA
jgi:hypothetical protein